MRRKRDMPAPSLLELQRERRETTELGYPGWCRQQPRKHRGPVPIHPWQRAWFMARDPSLCGEIGLHHRPGLILTLMVPHTWAPHRTCRDSPVPSPPMLATVTANQPLSRFCRAGPCRLSVMDPSSVTDKQT